MRDPTRGGLAAVLNELAIKGKKGIKIDETSIPANSTVTSLMELLGLDPYQLANEGAAVIIVSKKDAERALEVLRENPLGRKASIIGEIRADNPGQVIMETLLGTERIMQMPSGVIIPRIC
jgi:hydrogenase expression/formation protein HypE